MTFGGLACRALCAFDAATAGGPSGAAVQRLQARLDPLATAVLINRLNDDVPVVARLRRSEEGSAG